METNKNILLNLIEKSKTGFMKTLLGKKYEFLRKWIIEKTPKLKDPFFNWKTKIYWVLHDLDDFPKCEYCGKDIKGNVKNVFRGYTVKTCSKDCQYKLAIQHTHETCLEKYGVENVFQSEEFKAQTYTTCMEKYGVSCVSQIPGTTEKRKATCLERYGVEVPMQSPEIVEKSKKTQLDRYGVTSFTKTEAFIEKTNITCMDRYGTMFPSQSEQAKNAYKETCLDKYGVDSYSKTDEFLEKTRHTCFDRYGVESVWQSGAEGREKGRKTCLELYGSETYNNREQAFITCQERYGVSTPGENNDIRRKMVISNMKSNYQKLCQNKHVIPLFSEEEYLLKTKDSIFKWKCLDCGNEFETKINWNYYKEYSLKTVARCLTCKPIGFASTSEEEHDFINAIRKIYGGTILERQSILEDGKDKRSWKEIDCYLPDIKVGFEYDGIYFHQLSSYDDNSHKHIIKTKLAEKQGIALIHVRSDEWLNNQSQLLLKYKEIIDGKINFNVADDIIELDRSIYNKCICISGYTLIQETEPEKFELLQNNRKYLYEDCGKLIYRKINHEDERR